MEIQFKDGTRKHVGEDYARPGGGNLAEPVLWPAVMVDIETLATTDDAVILEMGAVMFDRERKVLGPVFSMTLDYLSQGDRRTDLDTVMWWTAPERIGRFREMQEGHERKPALWHGLLELEQFLRVHLAGKGEVWAKGDFDLRILGHAFREHEMEVPWKYHQARELRTVLKWTGVMPCGPVPHHAAEDAELQVGSLFAAEERKIRASGIDFEEGWKAYRTDLAETRGRLVPEWVEMDEEEREAWCLAVGFAVYGIPSGEVA